MNPRTDYDINPLGVLLFAAKATPEERRQLGHELQEIAVFRSDTRSIFRGMPIEPPGDELRAALELQRDDRRAIAERIRGLAAALEEGDAP